jgi:signal transduction histidine kinase
MIRWLILGRNRRDWPWAGRVAAVFLGLATTTGGQVTNPVAFPDSVPVITNLAQLYAVPREQNSDPHRMRTELLIYFFDAEWGAAWGECQGVPGWLPIMNIPHPPKAGQRIAIDGLIVPATERFVWNETNVRLLEENVTLPLVPVDRHRTRHQEFKARRVLLEGMVDRVKQDARHVILSLLTDGVRATVFILKDGPTEGEGDPGSPLPCQPGEFVRLEGVYAPQVDLEGKLGNLDLWVARRADVEVVGSLPADQRFDVSPTSSDEIEEGASTNNLLHVEGVVRKFEPGRGVTIWDAGGQLLVQGLQTEPLRVGDHIEAIGTPHVVGVQKSLRESLYRKRATPLPDHILPAGTPDRPLRLAAQIRDLSHEDAQRGLRVKLRGVVTWAHADADFAYVMDASGGVRVAHPRWDRDSSMSVGTIVTVEGATALGGYVPVVTNATLHRAGWWNLNFEPGPLVSLDQAMTGAEEGHWVEMRGYVRRVTELGPLRKVELTTASGEFEAWFASSRSYQYLEGTIAHVSGVCVALANARRQLTGIQVWSPESKYVIVEETETGDAFAGPMYPLGNLRRFNLESAFNTRIRTAGIVVLHEPGRYLYLQEGNDAVFALSRQTNVLQPGDRIELAGFPGRQGRRFLLRETVYRVQSSGAQTQATPLPPGHSVNLDLEGQLATAEGVLLNAVVKDGEARLLLQSGAAAFEVVLDVSRAATTGAAGAPPLGSRLAVTGVYEVQNDEYGKPRSFGLRLRSWQDVELRARPPWWTLPRLMRVLAVVVVVSAIAIFWSVLISRKNCLLSLTQAELQSAKDKLEVRVEERTRELREQVAAKERAHAELAEAQKSLMLASRQAGMAEVATGVLHNVGNVLNSVNVSTTLVRNRLRQCPLDSVGKAAALLHENEGQLGHFLEVDSRGRNLPHYLEVLGSSLVHDREAMQTELDSLTKNIEHIKAIVAMQQGFARLGGVIEQIPAADLMGDALQINAAALQRRSIQITRDYHPVPPVFTDRHKVMQILVNLISNACQAVTANPADRKLLLAIRAVDADRVSFTVSDNGVGIPPENLSRIFSQGFTTRSDGHGFGLHSGANAARELGGALTAHSEGAGQGATFILKLPTVHPKQAAAPAPDSPA